MSTPTESTSPESTPAKMFRSTEPTDEELIAFWREQPTPLLPLLHAFHERDGFVSEEAMRAIAQGLRIPLADLFGTVTFYHHLARQPGGLDAPRVCMGPICSLRGGGKLLARLGEQGATSMACAGRCDQPVPVLRGGQVLVGDTAQLVTEPSPLPVPNPGNVDECVFAQIREPTRHTLAGYRSTGGYVGLERALTTMGPEDVLEHVQASQLAGKGGAGFPTGVKWRAVAEAAGSPKTIVCNADEGEPGCFKDRAILTYDPHAVVEGMVSGAYATGASQGYIYLRYEYPEIVAVLTDAVEAGYDAGYLGADVMGSGFGFELMIRRGAGAYICGEETSLLNSLEGKHPFPRNRPPYPVTHGLYNLPTAVNNVETLAAVPPILQHDPAWYHGLGMGEHVGTKVISLSGDICRPGNYEIPVGLPLRTLLHEWAGGPLPGRSIQAVTMAGLSGGFLGGDDLDVTLDDVALRERGSFLGAGGVMVFDDQRDMVQVAYEGMAFFAHESCGKCFPCRIGTQRLTERLAGKTGPETVDAWLAEVHDIGRTMQALSACGLGTAAPHVTESLIRYFPEQIAQRLNQ